MSSNPSTGSGDGGDDDEAIGLRVRIILVGVVLLTCICCVYNNWRKSSGASDGVGPARRSSYLGNGQEDGEELSEEELKKNRADLIKRTLLTKKVVAAGEEVEDSPSFQNEKRGESGPESQKNGSVKSQTLWGTRTDSSSDDGAASAEQEGTTTKKISTTLKRKSNIIAQSLSAASASFFDGLSCSQHVREGTPSLSQHNPTCCHICLGEYKVGEDIAWSRNPKCTHAFHTECITEWLMKHDECPLCRHMYLVGDDGDQGQENHTDRTVQNEGQGDEANASVSLEVDDTEEDGQVEGEEANSGVSQQPNEDESDVEMGGVRPVLDPAGVELAPSPRVESGAS